MVRKAPSPAQDAGDDRPVLRIGTVMCQPTITFRVERMIEQEARRRGYVAIQQVPIAWEGEGDARVPTAFREEETRNVMFPDILYDARLGRFEAVSLFAWALTLPEWPLGTTVEDVEEQIAPRQVRAIADVIHQIIVLDVLIVPPPDATPTTGTQKNAGTPAPTSAGEN